LEWVVNGYEALERAVTPPPGMPLPEIGGMLAKLGDHVGAHLGDIKFPERKIGEVVTDVKQWMAELKAPTAPPPLSAAPAAPKPIPVPPPIRMNRGPRDGKK
jgi:hypothetical protein